MRVQNTEFHTHMMAHVCMLPACGICSCALLGTREEERAGPLVFVADENNATSGLPACGHLLWLVEPQYNDLTSA